MVENQKKFGKYYLLDLLAQGGMAEIYRARLAASDGAGRVLVIKKIQASYGENRDFLQMFKSEIKVTLGFNHPNIVQLYDFGEENHQPYIAMEWVDGRNLRQLLNRFAEIKRPFPIELATYIAERAAAGLQYAHSYRDKISGDHLSIVHRDISPQNILISFEGNVKVIDFGIAKAATNSESTRAGIIKGKPSYLSPEQISGEVLDGRSDIFALGAVLWETLTGKKLFAGENDLAVLKLIEGSSTHVKPPSLHNPDVPKELDEIVLRTLAKQRDRRYANAEDLARALHKFIYNNFNEFNPTDLAYYAKDLFKDEIVEDRKKIQKLNAEVEAILELEVRTAAPTELISSPRGTSRTPDEPRPSIKDNKPGPRSGTRGIEEFASSDEGSEVLVEKAPRNTVTQRSISKIRAAQIGTGSNSTPYQKGTQQTHRPNPSAPTSPLIGALLSLVGILLIAGLGPEYGVNVPWLSDLMSPVFNQNTHIIQANTTEASRSEASIVGNTATRAPLDKTILLRIQLSPGGGHPSIQLNGKALSANQLSAPVALDSPIELLVSRPGFKPFQSQFVVDSKQAAGLREWVKDIAIEPLHYGFLTLHTTPSATATLMIDDSPWIKKTPMESEKVPAGSYQIRLENDILGMSKVIQIKIEEGKTINLDEQLDVK